MKILLCPDSYKGTASSPQLCEAFGRAAARVFPGCELTALPAADGGEGSAECFALACGGRLLRPEVTGPFANEKVRGAIAILPGGGAVAETASCAGLPLVSGRQDPMLATTRGVGELILEAARTGARDITVALGGSCTTDGGAGCLTALGYRFFDGNGRDFMPTGGTLGEIAELDPSGLSPLLAGVKLTLMCDVDNPLFGRKGAAHIYAPQKGASPAQVKLLDAGLRTFAETASRCLGRELSGIRGGGAAGGLGAGLSLIPGTVLKSGIERFLEAVSFDQKADGADFAVTGEGMLDSQSLMGKAVSGIAGHCRRLGLPLYAIVGGSRDPDGIHEAGVTAVFTVNRVAMSLRQSAPHTLRNAERTAEELFRALAAAGKGNTAL